MIPGYSPGPSGQAAKVGILPYWVVTTTSFSVMLVSSEVCASRRRQGCLTPPVATRFRRRILAPLRSSGLQPFVKGDEFGVKLLHQPQIGGIVAGQSGYLGQFNRIGMLNLDNLDGHASVQREGSQQGVAPLRITTQLLQADAGDFKAQQGRGDEPAFLESAGDLLCFRLAEQQRGQRGGIDDLNGHPDRPE